MKVIIKNYNCPSCNGDYFSLDKNRNHYTNKEKTEGYFITTRTCLKCGLIEKFNKMEWKSCLDKGETCESNDNNTPCEVCHKVKSDVRFESSFEGFICDDCLEEAKRGL